MEESEDAGRMRAGVMNALKFGIEIWQRQPLLFLLICERSIPSPGTTNI